MIELCIFHILHYYSFYERKVIVFLKTIALFTSLKGLAYKNEFFDNRNRFDCLINNT